MSLTSYRAAPPRVGFWWFVFVYWLVLPVFLDWHVMTDDFVLMIFDRLDDLAATYSPVP